MKICELVDWCWRNTVKSSFR